MNAYGRCVLNTCPPPRPGNDNFAAAISTFPATGTTVGATQELGEPLHSDEFSTGKTIWYKFTPRQAGRLVVRLSAVVGGTGW